jgi:hypothetical protein
VVFGRERHPIIGVSRCRKLQFSMVQIIYQISKKALSLQIYDYKGLNRQTAVQFAWKYFTFRRSRGGRVSKTEATRQSRDAQEDSLALEARNSVPAIGIAFHLCLVLPSCI